MALIKCPECGRQISDMASNCPCCGFPIQQQRQEEQKIIKEEQERTKKAEQERKRKERFHKIKPFHIVGIVACAVVVVAIVLFSNKNTEYNNAVKSFESGDYKVAYEYFKNSNYKDSTKYREQTVIEYVKLLVEEKDFETADQMLSLITDKTVHDELQTELVYTRAVESYEIGAFELAYTLLQDIKDYKDAETYLKNAEMMKNIQGEWILSGTIVWQNKDVNYVALKIVGWNATLLYCTDGVATYEEAGSCRLNMTDVARASLVVGTTRYIITSNYSGDGEPVLVARMLHDDYIQGLEFNYTWKYFESENQLCFFKEEDGIPKKPAIGMTAQDVKKGAWGEPEDINKSTYSWGVKEQWCYSDNRYIYLENGVVTAISE